MFLVGEFSKISRVSKRLLHHYDEIGLLKPAFIDPNSGYRYYSAKQLPRLNQILALKGLGLTLTQIAQMVDNNISDDEIRGMLLLKKAEIEQTLADDYQRLNQIENRLKQNQRPNNGSDVVIKTIPAQPYLAIRKQFDAPEQLMQFIGKMVHVVPQQVKTGVLGAFTAVFHSDAYSETNHDVDLGYLLLKPFNKPALLSDDERLEIKELKAVKTMATMVQVGEPNPELTAFGQMAHWIEKNGYQIEGSFREIVLNTTNLDELEDAVFEFQIPIKRNEHIRSFL